MMRRRCLGSRLSIQSDSGKTFWIGMMQRDAGTVIRFRRIAAGLEDSLWTFLSAFTPLPAIQIY